jgi:hypothetical protein
MNSTQVFVDPFGEVCVTLCDEDYELAQRIGTARTAEARQSNRPGRAGCPPNNIEQDIDGAAAEIAFARVIGVAPSISCSPSREPDVAGFHIRSTSRPDGKLIVRPGDSKSNVYVLVVGAGKEWRIIGSAEGYEAARPEFWYDQNGRSGCYMLPQSKLRRLTLQLVGSPANRSSVQ